MDSHCSYNDGPHPDWPWALHVWPCRLSSFTWPRTLHLGLYLSHAEAPHVLLPPPAPGPLHWLFPLPGMLFLPLCQVNYSPSSASVWSSFLGEAYAGLPDQNKSPSPHREPILCGTYCTYNVTFICISFWLTSASSSSPLPSQYSAPWATQKNVQGVNKQVEIKLRHLSAWLPNYCPLPFTILCAAGSKPWLGY